MHSLAFACILFSSFSMTKTITLRLQENKYQRFKQLAEYDNRSISNFIENAALRFIEEGSNGFHPTGVRRVY